MQQLKHHSATLPRVGQSSDEILDSLRATSDGTISDYDLMLSANCRHDAGRCGYRGEMSSLVGHCAPTRAGNGSHNATGVQRYRYGLGAWRCAILDNLGIVIDLEETVYASYAQQLGQDRRTVDRS